MRGREFLMKDAYSFDLDEAGLRRSYEAMFVAYLQDLRAARAAGGAGAARRPARSAATSATNSTSSPTPARARSFTTSAIEEISREELLAADASTIARLTGLYAMRGGEACEGRELSGAGGAAAHPPRHRGRPHLRLRHQIFSASMGLRIQDAGRRPGPCRRWAATASASSASSAASSRRATTRTASSGRRASRPIRSA